MTSLVPCPHYVYPLLSVLSNEYRYRNYDTNLIPSSSCLLYYLLFFKSHISTNTSSSYVTGLSLNLLVAFSISAIVVMYVMYMVVKKGSKIGQKIVVHPQLLPDQLPN